jgi:hypothetical protein
MQTAITETFHDDTYRRYGFAAQRRYPNEELVRFLARHFFPIPCAERAAVPILEVGCGSGANLWMIAREGFAAHGLSITTSERVARSYRDGEELFWFAVVGAEKPAPTGA